MPEPAKTGAVPTAPALETQFSRGQTDPKGLFVPPACFAKPEAALDDLLTHAFTQSNIHAISGERGMGKTELARYFARLCCRGEDIREELRCNTVIWCAYAGKGLADAVANLPCTGRIDGDQYAAKLDMLKNIPKPCLLIFDNFDDEESYSRELSAASQAYMDLLSTGCHILLTSRINLSDCYAVSQTRLEPLKEARLLRLFIQASENTVTAEEEDKVRLLISRYLQGNTYLVVLAARLTATRTVDEPLEAFGHRSISSVGDHVTGVKDGARQPPRSLFDHFKALFDLSLIRSDPDKLRLMYNLSLLPLTGMAYPRFFESAFAPSQRDRMKTAFADLRDCFWVILRDRQVCLHPLVREIIIKSCTQLDFRHIKPFIDTINAQLDTVTYSPAASRILPVACAAFQSCEDYRIRNFETAILPASISSYYDTLRSHHAAYDYGLDAQERLRDFADINDAGIRVKLAKYYSWVGYSFVHAKHQSNHCTLAEEMLLAAQELVRPHLYTQGLPTDPGTLYSKIQGNLAGLYHECGDDRKSLQIHTEQKDYRQRLFENAPSPVTKTLLASAYKGIATDYFYLSRQAEPEEACRLLEQSLEQHRLSTAFYEEIYSPASLEAVIAGNRLVGTGVTLLNKRRALSALTGAELARLTEYLERMFDAAAFLCTIDPVAAEIENCLSNIAGLTAIAREYGICDADEAARAAAAARQLDALSFPRRKNWEPQLRQILRLAETHPKEACHFG